MEQKHILVITQYFHPEPFRINDMCLEWVKRGYKVSVLTGIPNYPQGEFYEGYSKKERRTENWNGVEIIRIPLVARGHSAAKLFLNYLSFVRAGRKWVRRTKLKADLVFTFEVSPMTQALIGVWYAKKFNVPNYLYVQDLWPENVEVVAGITNPLIIKPISRMVNYIYKNCTKIFATSPSFVKEIQKRVEDKEKVLYLPQYAEDFYQPLPRKPVPEIPNDGRFKIIFTGNIGKAQGLDILPKTAELLKGENIVFVIVGDGRYRDEFEKEIRERGVEDMFILIPRQPAERIPELLAVCDAAFLSFMNTPLFEKTIPAKLQSYMACGMPIIASASGETERIIYEADCGLCSPIGDERALVDKLLSFVRRDDMSLFCHNSEQYCYRFFNKDKTMDIMCEYLRSNHFEGKSQ